MTRVRPEPPTLELVVAADEAGGIGKGGDLPWRLKGDMTHFRELTTGPGGGANAVVMGRTTWESIPERFRPLSGRINIVLSRTGGFDPGDGVVVAGSLDEAVALAREAGVARIFVIGGGQVYTQALQRSDTTRVHLTRVRGTFDCDTFLPPLPDGFGLASAGELVHEPGGIYDIAVFERPPEPGRRGR